MGHRGAGTLEDAHQVAIGVSRAILELVVDRDVDVLDDGAQMGDVEPALTPATYPVISAIERFGPSTASSLADELGLDRSVVSRRAMTLVHAGLLHTTSRPDDKRQVLFKLTDTGAESVHAMRLRLDAAVARHISRWTSAERAGFASLLARFVEAGTPGAAPGLGQTSSKGSHPAIS